MRFRHHRSQQPRRQYDEHDATEKHSKRKASKSLPSALSAESKVSSTARSTIHAPSFILGVILMLLAKTLFVAIEQANSPVVANNNEAIGKTPIDNANGSEEGPLGSFKWKSIQIGKKSGEKLFWVQGKTNGEGHYFYERILISNGWLRARRQEEPGILLHFSSRVVPKITSDFKYFLPGQNIVNRIPGEYAIWSKEPLLKNLRDFASRHDGCDIRRVHPDSYILNEPIDCQSFFHPSTDTGSIYRDNTTIRWFWKPPSSSFGRGIRLVSKEKLRSHMRIPISTREEVEDSHGAVGQNLKEACEELSRKFKTQKLKSVVQAAVHPPLLIGGSKFDIRAYILIANTYPFFVFSRIGHIRRCLLPYGIESEHKKAHVCNDYSDRLEDDNFDITDHLWSFEEFTKYIEAAGIHEKVPGLQRASSNDIRLYVEEELQRLFLTVFLSAKDKIRRANGYWSLLGVDVAVMDDMTMRVLEVNTNPSVHYDTKVWPEFQPQENLIMMGEVLELVLTAHEVSAEIIKARAAEGGDRGADSSDISSLHYAGSSSSSGRIAATADRPSALSAFPVSSDAGWRWLYTDAGENATEYSSVISLCGG